MDESKSAGALALLRTPNIVFGSPTLYAKWMLKDINARHALTIKQRHNISDILSRIVAARTNSLEEADHFLSPSIKHQLPDPFHLHDMNKAVDRIIQAIEQQEVITIYGDYDVDGATSTALFTRFFAMLGVKVSFYIPDRIVEGYGPNTEAFMKLHQQGTQLIITVDCGTVSHEPITAATQAGTDVIVIDHHIGTDDLPPATAIVNPNRLDENSPYRNLAAVGVSFLVCVALCTRLKEQGFFAKHPAPDLLSLLDIVALGTVCDVMTLTGLNRAFVSQGLKVMAQRKNLGLRTLSDVARLDASPSCYHLGFVLGPRINAGGRVGKADLGSTLLTTHDPMEAKAIALELDRLNAERKTIESLVLDEAIAQVEQRGHNAPLLLVRGEGWHPGVIGIVASRLKEKYHKPAAVIAIENGIGKASARSVAGLDLGALVVHAKQLGHLVAGGGHSMAAGFTVEADKIDILEQFLCNQCEKQVATYQQERALEIDAVLSISSVNVALAQSLDVASPFGVGNPSPRIVISQCYLIKADILKEEHVRCIFGHDQSGGTGGSLKAMMFRAMETPLGDILLNAKGKRMDIAGQIKLNHWQGRTTAEFTLEDVVFLD